MRIRRVVAGLGVATATIATATIATVTVAAGGAGAATMFPDYIGWSGGSMVTALGGAVRSDLTAESYINTAKTGVTSSNSTAHAYVADLITTGAIQSSTSSVAVPDGGEVVSHARTADVSLLGGAITAKAVDTVATVKRTGATTVSTTANTTFVGIHIAGANLPITIRKNFGVNIPGVASVTLNAVQSFQDNQGQIVTNAVGLYVTLLKPIGNNPAGTTISLNISHSSVINIEVGPGTVGGVGYSTQVVAKAGSLAGLNSDPTAREIMPPGGTQGKPVTNSTAAINIPSVLQAGALTSTVTGTIGSDGSEDALVSNSTAKVNVLGGLIKADAISVSAHATKTAAGQVSYQKSMQVLNLSIAGKSIPVTVSPNTVITVGNLLKVTLYDVATTTNAIGVIGIRVQLLSPYNGLQTGSVINVAAAAAQVG